MEINVFSDPSAPISISFSSQKYAITRDFFPFFTQFKKGITLDLSMLFFAVCKIQVEEHEPNSKLEEHNSTKRGRNRKYEICVKIIWKNVWNDVNMAEMSQAEGASRVLLTRSGCCVSEKWRCKTWRSSFPLAYVFNIFF